MRSGFLSFIIGATLALSACNTTSVTSEHTPEDWQEIAVREPRGEVTWTTLGAEQIRAETDCFPDELVDLVAALTAQIGPIEITSGHRKGRGRSLHHHCKAVDFRPLNVSNQKALAVMRELPGVGGIGSYRRTDILHMDIGERREWRF